MKNSIMTDSELCSNTALERPRYFARQMLTQAELTLEQNYFRDRLRRHNRLLHGWGVVCGANICAIPNADQSGPEPWKVRVTPGYILGPYGDEIVIDCERVVDLRTAGVTGMAGESPAEQVDPWCSEVFVDRREGPFYVAVKFKEVMTRPVRVQPIGCGCDDNQCEYSRWRDGYEIGILSECPESHLDLHEETTRPSRAEPLPASGSGAATLVSPPGDPHSAAVEAGDKEEDEPPIYFKNGCPPCPSDPWVVLGVVQIDSDGTLTSIDNCACRRMAPTLALLARACHRQPIEIRDMKAGGLQVGATNVPIEVFGVGFETGIRVSLGSGVKVKEIKVEADGTRLTFTADVSPHAVAGARTMTITNPDCSTITKEVTVAPATVAPPSPQPAAPIQPGQGATTATQPAAQPAAQPATPAPAQPVTERVPSRRGRRRGGG